MSYWIYHDKVTPAAKLHRNTCGACKDGHGMHGHQKRSENAWYGAFERKQQALQNAQARGISALLTDCGLCKP
jgi:hypothetical protein